MANKKQAIVLQHFHENPPGRVGNVLDKHGIHYDLIHVGEDMLPDPKQYGAILVLGGTQHLYDKEKYPYTVHEEQYIQQAITDHVPYLGMCLGGQLLANTFNAPIRKLPKEEIGFLRIEFTDAGNKDPLYKGLNGSQLAFQWHEDCFELPEGAVELAYEVDGANQSFRYLDTAYGIQYHLELTQDLLDLWLHDPSLKQEFIDRYGTEQYAKVEQQAVELYPEYNRNAETMLANFLHISKLI